MSHYLIGIKRLVWMRWAAASASVICVAGCGTPWPYVGGVAGVAAVGGYSPGQEIEQTYYLGVFDPQEQVPPTIYRLSVHGQASVLSSTKFASGWVRSELIDSLNTRVGQDLQSGAITATTDSGFGTMTPITTGRRLVMFGPEGFREAPSDHRLVIVMGSSPQSFFSAVDEALGSVTSVAVERNNSEVQRKIFEQRELLLRERDRLADLGDEFGG